MQDLYLLVRVAGQTAALSAAMVESVIEIDHVAPVPRAASHVMGLFALRSRVLTVIDTVAALEAGRSVLGESGHAVTVSLDGHLYGLLVEAVDDVVSIPVQPTPPRAVLSPGWARMSTGVIEYEGEPLMLLNIAALIAGPASLAA